MENVEGFYALYITAVAGNNIGMIALKNGVISGADAAGALFDGSYTWDQEKKVLYNKLQVTISGNMPLIQGGVASPEGLVYEANFQVSFEKEDIPYFRVDTPVGAVNVKMVKLRNLG
jgi:hypothetical protein